MEACGMVLGHGHALPKRGWRGCHDREVGVAMVVVAV